MDIVSTQNRLLVERQDATSLPVPQAACSIRKLSGGGLSASIFPCRGLDLAIEAARVLRKKAQGIPENGNQGFKMQPLQVWLS